MVKYLLHFSYDGSKYYGYAKQVGKNTIQNEIEKLLSSRFNKVVKIYASGRTDKGVHAYEQTAHFEVEKPISLNSLKKYLNDQLDKSIYITSIEEVDKDFHARYSVKMKQYLYKINIGEFNPIEKDFIYQYNKKINIKQMKKVSKYLLGKHDFRVFTPESNEKEDYIRTIYDIKIKKINNYVYFYITGSGFLRYMVRNMIGLFLSINEETIDIKDLERILLSKRRRNLGKTAPSEGLYLNKVYY